MTAAPEHNDLQELERRLDARFIEQEHRLACLLMNAWEYRKLPESDPRRNASRKAIFYRLAVSLVPSTAVGGVSLIALLSLLVAYQSNRIAQEELASVRESNAISRGEVVAHPLVDVDNRDNGEISLQNPADLEQRPGGAYIVNVGKVPIDSIDVRFYGVWARPLSDLDSTGRIKCDHREVRKLDLSEQLLVDGSMVFEFLPELVKFIRQADLPYRETSQVHVLFVNVVFVPKAINSQLPVVSRFFTPGIQDRFLLKVQFVPDFLTSNELDECLRKMKFEPNIIPPLK